MLHAVTETTHKQTVCVFTGTHTPIQRLTLYTYVAITCVTSGVDVMKFRFVRYTCRENVITNAVNYITSY